MKPFVLLVFEIHCYETEPLVKIQWGRNWSKNFEWGRKKPTDPQASLWLHISTDVPAQTRIPADLEQCCTQLCGPVSWETADQTLRGLKACFEALNLEYFELTCSDD